MNSKWSLKFTNAFKTCVFLSSFFLLSNTSILAQQKNIQKEHKDDFDALLMAEHTTVALCGELHYKRQSRNCLKATDLKRCLDLNHIDPLFAYQEKPSYSCVNSSYTAGVDIIKDKLIESEQNGGCLAGNFRNYFSEVIDSSEFLSLAKKFEEGLGQPLKLNYGIDTKDGLFNLQMDTSHIESSSDDMINISIGSFSEKGHCEKLSSKEIMAKITDEFNRLSLKIAREEYDYFGDDQSINARVFDASRYNQEEGNSKSPASASQKRRGFTHTIKQ